MSNKGRKINRHLKTSQLIPMSAVKYPFTNLKVGVSYSSETRNVSMLCLKVRCIRRGRHTDVEVKLHPYKGFRLPPLLGTTVTLKGVIVMTVSIVSGKALFPNIPDGEYRITIS